MTAEIQEFRWARIEVLTDAADLRITAVGSPAVGMDRLALVRFSWPTSSLEELLHDLGITKPLRSGYRAITGPVGGPDADTPEWWTPYRCESARGARGLWQRIGREIMVHPGRPDSTVFLRTYET